MKNGHFSSVSLSRHPVQLVILISFFFSPASDAGVLPPLWRGRVLPFTVQSRDHLATITDIYVPSFPYIHSPTFNAGFYFVHCAMENCLDLAIRTGGAAGSDAPTQTLIRLFRRTGRPADTLVYKSHTHAYVCIVLRKGCPPVRLVYPLPSILRLAFTSSNPLSLTIHPRGPMASISSRAMSPYSAIRSRSSLLSWVLFAILQL